MTDPATIRARRATLAVFFACGIALSSWAPMVPFVKSRLGLNDAGLGLVLLALGAGALAAMPVSGFLINRWGSRVTMLAAIILFSLVLPFLTLATTPLGLALSLGLFGAGIGAVDVAMNAQAVVVERRLGRPVMSSFHGFYSVGGLAGASGMSLLLDAGWSLTTCALVAATLGFGCGLWQFSRLLPRAADNRMEGTTPVLPRGPVILFGAVCFIAFLAEGAILDWSAVFLRFFRSVEEANAGMGFAVASLTMAVGRLTGDRVTHRLGAMPTLRAGAAIAGLGYAVVVLVPTAWAALTGFALVGLGVANVVPLMFSAAGRLSDPPPSVSIPAVTTMGYTGLLAGPALIGFISQTTTLPVALGLVAVALLAIAVLARRILNS